jgi:hypothetical protein
MSHGAGKAAKQSGSNTRGGKINLQRNQNEKLSLPGGSQSNPDGTM